MAWNNPQITLELRLGRTTEKAIQVVSKKDILVWLPKSLINIKSYHGEFVRFDISETLAMQKGIWH